MILFAVLAVLIALGALPAVRAVTHHDDQATRDSVLLGRAHRRGGRGGRDVVHLGVAVDLLGVEGVVSDWL